MNSAPAERQIRPLVPDVDKVWLLPLDLHLKAVADLLTPATRAALEAEFAPYWGASRHPLLVGNQLVDRICAGALGHLPLPVAQREFGLRYSRRQRDTILGRVMIAAAPLMSIEQGVRRLPQLFANSCNFGSRAATELGPRHWQLDFADDCVYLEVMAGLLDSGLGDVLHPPGLRVVGRTVAPGHLVYDVRWEVGHG